MEHYQGDDFPVHIDLGKMPDKGMELDAAPSSGKKGKPKPYYPTLYISGIKGLEDIPKDGCALIEFKRKNVNISTPSEGEPHASVELEIHTICLMDKAGDSDGEDLKTAMAKAMKGSGVDTEGYEGDDDNESDGDEETEGEG